MADKKLAVTIHHAGRIFTKGMTAAEIGPLAGEFGDHCWEGGKAPAESAIPGKDAPTGGLTLGDRIVPPPSGLPGNTGGVDRVVEQLQTPLLTPEETGAVTEPEPPHPPPAGDAIGDSAVSPPASTGDTGTPAAKKAAPKKATGTTAA